jgi:hypothetical protein
MQPSNSGPAGSLTATGGGSPMASGSQGGSNLADVLERVLDKGVVIAGDIQINLLDIELLTIKLRLVVASVDTARRMGIKWWETDPALAGGGGDDSRSLSDRVKRLERELGAGSGDSDRSLEEENRELRERLERLERSTKSSEGGE